MPCSDILFDYSPDIAKLKMTQKLLVWLFIEPWHGSALGLGVVYLPLHFLKTEWWVQAQFYPQPENEKMRTRSQIPGFYNPQLSLKSIMETMTMFLKVGIGRNKKTSPIALKKTRWCAWLPSSGIYKSWKKVKNMVQWSPKVKRTLYPQLQKIHLRCCQIRGYYCSPPALPQISCITATRFK